MSEDRLNAIGVLKRREIEARILAPMLEAMMEEFGKERVLEIARETIICIARQQGEELTRRLNGNDLERFAGSLDDWKKDDAMQTEMLEQTEDKLFFNVVRCRYAEMYRDLGIPELGALLSCNRDAALIEGFNPNVSLARTQTIMQGASFCDFRYHLGNSDRRSISRD